MEALSFSATLSPLLCHNRLARKSLTRRSAKPFIAASLYKSAAEVLSRENPSNDYLVVPPDSLQYDPGYIGAVPVRPEHGSDGMEHLTQILTSKVYGVAIESPLQLASRLSEKVGSNIWLKREDSQSVFSFKLRGAYNMMANLPEEQLKKGVICASAGNHAQGVALSAQKLNCKAVIIMPLTTPEIKSEAVRRLGGDVKLVGDTFDDAQAYAQELAKQKGYTVIPPFDNLDIIMGQGTVGMEIVRQMQSPIHAIFVPVGGGGLVSGVAAYVRRVLPDVKIIGVEPTDANSMALSFHHDQRVILEWVGGFADGVAVKQVGEENFRLCKELIDGIVLVNRAAMSASIKAMFEDTRSILEPSGALAMAGAEAYCKYYNIKGENIVAVCSGANMDFDKLRVIADLADLGSCEEAMLATILPEQPGSLKLFCQLVGPMNITELKYRYNSDKKAVVLYSVGVRSVSEIKALEERMESSQFRTNNLSKSDLVKDHLRYLMGGQSDVQHEVLCRFVFPERPGALMKFLDSFSPRWNITLFHYRAEGETVANVLVGIQVPKHEMVEFQDCADKLGYYYAILSNDDGFHLLMR